MCEDCARERAAREAGPGACPDTSVSHGRKPRAPTFDEECFWKKVEKAGPDECWLWKGARAQSGFGYGSFRKTNAHRWLYIHLHGPLPRNRVVMHSCDNKLCVNPAHLSAGSNADNCWDASRKGRLHNQIPRETINEIKRRRLAGESSTTIAADLGLSANHLRKVAVVNACPACIRSRTYAADLRERLIAAESALAAEREAHAETRKEINALKSERNAALELAEKRGAAYDMTWREVESLRERLDKEEEERGRQYGLRVQAEAEVEQLQARLRDKWLLEAEYEAACGDRDAMARAVDDLRLKIDALSALVKEWLDGNARLGRPKSIADQRFLNGLNAVMPPTFTHWSGTATKPEGEKTDER